MRTILVSMAILAVTMSIACGGSGGSRAPAAASDTTPTPQPTVTPPAPTPTPTITPSGFPVPTPTPIGTPQPPPAPTPQPPAPPAPAETGFGGTWTGIVTDATTCGSELSTSSYVTRWSIDLRADTANVATEGGNCSPYVVDVEKDGNVAHFRSKQCQPFEGSDGTVYLALGGGDLQLTGGRIVARMYWNRTVTKDGASRSCRTVTDATFQRGSEPPEVPLPEPTPTPTPPPADVSGRFTGDITDVTTCEDGHFTQETYSATWEVSTSGGSATIATGGSCSPYVADLNEEGTVGTLRSKECPVSTMPEGEQHRTLDRGALSRGAQGDRLYVEMRWTSWVTGSSRPTYWNCVTSTTGTLLRR